MENASIQQKFTAALDALVEQVKEDRSVLAAILCGSLAHDTVWAKSDIDLVLVTLDDRKIEPAVL
jgi:predicted nucleotidyltransferase